MRNRLVRWRSDVLLSSGHASLPEIGPLRSDAPRRPPIRPNHPGDRCSVFGQVGVKLRTRVCAAHRCGRPNRTSVAGGESHSGGTRRTCMVPTYSLAPLLPCSLAPLLPCSLAPLLPCSLAPLLPCSLAPLLPCSLAPLLPCSLAPLLPCSLAPLLPCSLAPLLPCSLAPLLPCSLSNYCCSRKGHLSRPLSTLWEIAQHLEMIEGLKSATRLL